MGKNNKSQFYDKKKNVNIFIMSKTPIVFSFFLCHLFLLNPLIKQNYMRKIHDYHKISFNDISITTRRMLSRHIYLVDDLYFV